jgi:glycosyltransferase involved in cell wall biosynthesis
VIRYRAGRIKGVGLARRAINEMALSHTALLRAGRALNEAPADVIVYYSPSIFFGPLVDHLKRRWNAPTYLVLRDIFPEWAVDAGVMKRGLAYWVFKLFERLQYEAADVIGVETFSSLRYFQGGAFERKTEILRNWTTTSAPPAPRRCFREELALEDKVLFVIGGNIGVAQDMDNLVRLAGRMQNHPEAHFLIVGDGSERQRIVEAVDADGLKNTTILGAVAPDTYLEILATSDVGIVTLDRRLKTSSTTGKLLGYLRCGLPILASYNPGNDLEQLLRESGAGLGSVNGEDDLFHRNACLLCDASRRLAMSESARLLLREHFSVENIGEQVVARLLDDRQAL